MTAIDHSPTTPPRPEWLNLDLIFPAERRAELAELLIEGAPLIELLEEWAERVGRLGAAMEKLVDGAVEDLGDIVEDAYPITDGVSAMLSALVGWPALQDQVMRAEVAMTAATRARSSEAVDRG